MVLYGRGYRGGYPTVGGAIAQGLGQLQTQLQQMSALEKEEHRYRQAQAVRQQQLAMQQLGAATKMLGPDMPDIYRQQGNALANQSLGVLMGGDFQPIDFVKSTSDNADKLKELQNLGKFATDEDIPLEQRIQGLNDGMSKYMFATTGQTPRMEKAMGHLGQLREGLAARQAAIEKARETQMEAVRASKRRMQEKEFAKELEVDAFEQKEQIKKRLGTGSVDKYGKDKLIDDTRLYYNALSKGLVHKETGLIKEGYEAQYKGITDSLTWDMRRIEKGLKPGYLIELPEAITKNSQALKWLKSKHKMSDKEGKAWLRTFHSPQ